MDSLREVAAGRDRTPSVSSRRSLSALKFFLALSLLGFTSAPAFASTAEEINALPTLDALNRSEEVFSNSGKWSALAWASSTTGHSTGRDTTTGWGPYDAFATVNGAFWNPAAFSDKTGNAAAITMQTGPGGSERYVGLWLNMPNPGSAKTGYQLRWIVNSTTSTYTVTLSKWSAGIQTVLAANPSVSIPAGTTMAISDTGGTVTAWQGTGGTLSPLFSASDAAYTSGYAGIEGSGNISRSINFKAGTLSGGSSVPPDTTISGGPKGVVVPNMQFLFSATEPGSSFECALDGTVFSACTSPKPYQGLAEGSRTFRVRATGAGGVDQTPAERGFQVVTAAKATSKVVLLDNLERQEVPLATGKWSKSSWAAEIGGAWMGSYRGYGSSGGLAGAYWNPTTFSDGEGTTLVAGAVGTGSVPSGQYSALLLNMPNPSGARSGYEARFTGTGSATNYTVELAKWVSGARTVLASTTGFSLPVGTTMALTETTGGSLALWTGTTSLSAVLSASDYTYTSGYAGLEVNGAAGTVYNFRAGRIDIQAPDTTITSGPTGTVPPASVSFGFTASEGGASFECSLDGAAYSPCSSPKAYPTIASGAHSFRVRAFDAVGNQDATPAERSFQVLQPPTAATAPATGVGASTATLKANVNPNGGETTYQFEYGTTAAYGSKVPATAKMIGAGSANVEVGEAIGGFTPGTTYHFRISATNAAGTSKGEDRTFTTVAAPTTTIEPASDLSAFQATLRAAVNPRGDATTYQFEYGKTTAYGTKVPATAKAIGSGFSAVSVNEAVGGLAQGATYHYRVVAQNSVGTTQGADQVFATPLLPQVTTGAPTGVDPNEAVFTGTVDPNGTDTTYKYEFGTTSAYGSTIFSEDEAGVGAEPDEVEEGIADLKPSTTYHYRVVASSPAGTVVGADQIVTTPASSVGAGQEAAEEAQDENYTAAFTPQPGNGFFNLHWSGIYAEQNMNYMKKVAVSGARMLRIALRRGADPCAEEEQEVALGMAWQPPEKPWGEYDKVFDNAWQKGINILPYLEGRPLPEQSEWGMWKCFARQVVRRYGPGGNFWQSRSAPRPVKAWEIWNEPNRAINGVDKTHANPIVFGDFLGEIAGVIRAMPSENPEIIVGGLLSRKESENGDLTVGAFIKKMGHTEAYDALGLHPYAFKTDDGKDPTQERIPGVIHRVRGNILEAHAALVDANASNKEIWITELGWPVATKAGDDGHPAVGLPLQGELLKASAEMIKNRRVEYKINRVFYSADFDYAGNDDWAYHCGLVRPKEHGHFEYRPAWNKFVAQTQARWPRPPKIGSRSATDRHSRRLMLNADIDADGVDSEFNFFWEAANNPTDRGSSGWRDAGFEEGFVARSVEATELQPDTTYNYHVEVKNDAEDVTDSGVSTARTEPLKETTATVTDKLNGEPGWASVAGWSKYDGVGLNGFKVRVNFLRSDGAYVSRDATLVNGQYHVDNVPLGPGTWETWSVFLAQGGYPESSSGYHQIKIKNGYKLIVKHSQKCLDVNGGAIGNGAPMIQYKCEDPQAALNQIFSLVPMDDQHHYQMVARHSNRCVGVTAGSQQAGVQLSQYDCLGAASTHQIWKSEAVLPNGLENSYNRFIAQSSGQCMEVRESSGANGGIVDQYGCAGAQDNQLWTFESVEGNQVPTQTSWTIDQNDTYHGMPGYVSFHGRIDIGERAYPLALRKVHVYFDRPNAQGQYDGVPDKEHIAETNAAGEYFFKYLGIARDTWRVWAVFYGTGDALGKSESAVHSVTIKSGYRLMFRSSQKCLTTSGNGTANGTWMIQWTCNPNWDPWDGQVFSLYPVDPVGSNHWQLRPNTANNPPFGQCVDVYGASTANGAPLNLYQCTPGAANQVWSFPPLGSPNLGWFGGFAMHSNKCMDVTAGNPNNGVQIEQYECVWNSNQQFVWLEVP
jgi:hypothetical protein